MRRASNAGFSLIEIALVLVVAGLVMGIGVPAVGRYLDDVALEGAIGKVRSTARMTRSRAMATRTSQTMLFQQGYSGSDYRVEIDGVMKNGWTLPRGISYASLSGTITSFTVTPDGRCSASGLIILRNSHDRMDTLSVLSSGLVLDK